MSFREKFSPKDDERISISPTVTSVASTAADIITGGRGFGSGGSFRKKFAPEKPVEQSEEEIKPKRS